MISKRVVTNILRGNKCIFCEKYDLYRLNDKRVKCRHCRIKYSIERIRKEINILHYFYLDISAPRQHWSYAYPTEQSTITICAIATR